MDRKDIEAINTVLMSIKRARWLEIDGEEILSLNAALAQLLDLRRRIETGIESRQAPLLKTSTLKSAKR